MTSNSTQEAAQHNAAPHNAAPRPSRIGAAAPRSKSMTWSHQDQSDLYMRVDAEDDSIRAARDRARVQAALHRPARGSTLLRLASTNTFLESALVGRGGGAVDVSDGCEGVGACKPSNEWALSAEKPARNFGQSDSFDYIAMLCTQALYASTVEPELSVDEMIKDCTCSSSSSNGIPNGITRAVC